MSPTFLTHGPRRAAVAALLALTTALLVAVSPSGPAGAHGGRDGAASSRGTARTAGAACSRMAAHTGLTKTTITLANIADVSGAEPGLHADVQDAMKAYVAWFDAHHRLCGRRLQLLALDGGTDASSVDRDYVTACHEAFAAVGSLAVFDTPAPARASACGLPDLHSRTTAIASRACRTCFSVQASSPDTYPATVPDQLKAADPTAAAHVGFLYLDEGAASSATEREVAAWTKRGLQVSVDEGVPESTFNYAPYVARLQSSGVQLVRLVGFSAGTTSDLLMSMQQQGYHPSEVVADAATAYTTQFTTDAGSAATGVEVYLDAPPTPHPSPEVALYERWLRKVAPESSPTLDGLYAWSAGRLFTQEASRLGGRLSRKNLNAALRDVHAWTDHDAHVPQDVGGGTTPRCWRFVRWTGTAWVPAGPAKVTCGGLVRLGTTS